MSVRLSFHAHTFPPSRLRDGGVPPYNLKRYTIHGKKASFAVHCPSGA